MRGMMLMSALVLGACAKKGESETAMDDPAMNADEEAGRREATATSDEGTRVGLAGELVEQCGIAMDSTFFSVASDDLDVSAMNRLDEVATCLNEGALSGNALTVTGYSDPQGSAQYNAALAASRAEAVARYLEARGLSRDRITVNYVGERVAGSDPEEWPLDRRVDLSVNRAGSVKQTGELPEP